MENSKKDILQECHPEKSVEMFEELFDLSKTLREMSRTITPQLEQIKANPVTFMYQRK
jgi:hypothetical protein